MSRNIDPNAFMPRATNVGAFSSASTMAPSGDME